jgi:hypothetical protein
MERHYYRMSNEEYVPERWYLKDPVSPTGAKLFAPWGFRALDQLQDIGPLSIPVKQEGRLLDIDFTLGSSVLVVSERAAPVFHELALNDVQLIPTEVVGHPGRYFVVNTARIVDCVDAAACRAVRYVTPEHMQPNRIGEYYYIRGLRLDTSKIGDARVFRLERYLLPLIVSEEVKEALERIGAVGGHFERVTGPHAPNEG